MAKHEEHLGPLFRVKGKPRVTRGESASDQKRRATAEARDKKSTARKIKATE
jgi:hypothetical protein